MKRKILTEVDRKMVIAQIRRLDLKKRYSVEIIERKRVRTISQNRLYWLWLTCIEFETGNDRAYLHEYFKAKYLQPNTIYVFDDPLVVYSTTNLNTTEFKYYLDHIQIFASSELGIALPDPEDKYWDEFYQYYVDKL